MAARRHSRRGRSPPSSERPRDARGRPRGRGSRTLSLHFVGPFDVSRPHCVETCPGSGLTTRGRSSFRKSCCNRPRRLGWSNHGADSSMRFPRPSSCANAPLADVLRLWSGLGFPRRAKSLHGAARSMVERFDAAVPSSIDDLLSLPGVGPYTAHAVASFAFDLPVAVLDTNVGRVLSRALANRACVRERPKPLRHDYCRARRESRPSIRRCSTWVRSSALEHPRCAHVSPSRDCVAFNVKEERTPLQARRACRALRRPSRARTARFEDVIMKSLNEGSLTQALATLTLRGRGRWAPRRIARTIGA